ncbi:hypothetical protein H1C71_003637 [Ictidomys tridecemlineatus]|nr:hypothetical protein H1C71_003637 [Ictidomys tridecemlineatus]
MKTSEIQAHGELKASSATARRYAAQPGSSPNKTPKKGGVWLRGQVPLSPTPSTAPKVRYLVEEKGPRQPGAGLWLSVECLPGTGGALGVGSSAPGENKKTK